MRHTTMDINYRAIDYFHIKLLQSVLPWFLIFDSRKIISYQSFPNVKGICAVIRRIRVIRKTDTEQAYNSSFYQKIELVQYSACLTVTGAIRGTSKEKLYN